MKLALLFLPFVVSVVVLAAAASAPAQGPEDCRVVEDFSRGAIGELPPDWRVREEEGKGVYALQEEGGRRYLKAHARGLGIQAAKAYEWDLNAYPVLAWSWRPIEFPRGANEQQGKNDSALAVYLLGPYSRVLGFKSVKYIWSEQVPAGTRLSSSRGRTQVRVLRSGNAERGMWVDERVNVRDDYLTFFEETEVPKPAGIAVLTDSDDTGSSAQGHYANFRVCRR